MARQAGGPWDVAVEDAVGEESWRTHLELESLGTAIQGIASTLK